MEQNPLLDMIDKVKQEKREAELQSIKNDIQFLKKGHKMTKLIELEVYQTIGGNTLTKKVSINPEYIVYIEEKDSNAIVHINNNVVLHTVESRTEILKLISEGSANQTYIG